MIPRFFMHLQSQAAITTPQCRFRTFSSPTKPPGACSHPADPTSAHSQVAASIGFSLCSPALSRRAHTTPCHSPNLPRDSWLVCTVGCCERSCSSFCVNACFYLSRLHTDIYFASIPMSIKVQTFRETAKLFSQVAAPFSDPSSYARGL